MRDRSVILPAALRIALGRNSRRGEGNSGDPSRIRLVMEISKRSARKEGSSNKFDQEEGSLQDIITEDGILCSILSHLRLREAVATCVLSPRWRQLWIDSQLRTDRHKLCFSIDTMFDSNTLRLICAQDTPLTQKEILELAKGKTIQFIQAVNSVLQQLKGRGEVDEFQLRYFLHRKHSHHLDAWVCFALKSNTKVLALYLHNPFDKEPVRRPYDFPFWLLGPSSLEDLTLQGCSLKPPHTFDGLTNLKILKLYYIDLVEEDITRLLANCHTLEQLMLESSPRLTTLSIPHSSSQLNKLVVKHCPQLREIHINAINLRTLFYWGYPADIMLSQSSSLEDLTLQCCSLKLLHKFDGLTNLKILKLYCIDLIEEDITSLLANCHTLEQLMLECSLSLRTLSIPHPLNQLNKLVVKHCHLLREININAINLRTLFYWGYPADLILSQSSQLEDVNIFFQTKTSDPTLDFYITQLFRNLPQLPSLVFRIAGDLGVSKMLKSPRGSNRFSRLTRLNWCWSVSVKMSLFDLATLMDAFPILEEFSLTLRLTKGTFWLTKCMLEDPPTENLTELKCTLEDPPTENLIKLKKRIPEHPHTHLKTIEIVGFYYETWQIEIALYFFKNAIELQSITINEDRRGLDEMQRKKLSQLAPANVKLVIPVVNV